MYRWPKIGPRLRQLQRGLRAPQFREDLEVHNRAGEIARPPRLQGQPDLPLHESAALEGGELGHADLRLPGSSALSKVVVLGYSAKKAFEPFKHYVFRPFRDAGYG